MTRIIRTRTAAPRVRPSPNKARPTYDFGVERCAAWDEFLNHLVYRDAPEPCSHAQLLRKEGAGGLYWWLHPRHVDSPMKTGNWTLVSWYKGWPHCRKDGIFIGPVTPPWE